MKDYKYKTTLLIAKNFEERDIKYHVTADSIRETLSTYYPIENGPVITMMFNSSNKVIDVASRIASRVPEGKRYRVLEACNELNGKNNYFKFILNEDGDIYIKYDFPIDFDDDRIGEKAIEIIASTVRMLASEYVVFMKALYTSDPMLK